MLNLLIFMSIAFLLGSIPFGLLYAMIRGVDIRKTGSGNIGATNVSRQFGFWGGFFPILILDMAKGIIPLVLFRYFTAEHLGLFYQASEILIGFSAILGHIFSPWLGFKGGKGVATAGGVLFAWNPFVASVLLISWLIILLLFKKSSGGFSNAVGKSSVISASLFPMIVYFTPDTSIPLQIASFIIMVLIIVAHKKNIKAWIAETKERQR